MMPLSPILNRNKIQEEIAQLNGTDFGSLRKHFSRRNSPGMLTSTDIKQPLRNGRFNKLFKLTTPNLQDAGIQALVARYPPKASKDGSQDVSKEDREEIAQKRR